ncbi:hypothetical protein BGZ98_004130, partial [Dissophora globulifera]
MMRKEYGYQVILIKYFIADVTRTDLTVRQQRKLGIYGTVVDMTLDEVKNHFTGIRDPAFDSRNYNCKGYPISILPHQWLQALTLCLQVERVALCTLSEASSAKLPFRLTLAVGGTDNHLQEIRNV